MEGISRFGKCQCLIGKKTVGVEGYLVMVKDVDVDGENENENEDAELGGR